MILYLNKIWNYVSHIGTNKKWNLTDEELKVRIFFNRCVFIGFFALIGSISSTYCFIGGYAFLNLINCSAIIIAQIAHHKGFFNFSKRIVVYSLFTNGILLTSLSGGDFLYHTGIITVLTFAWVVFHPNKERLELIFFFLLATSVYVLGELNIFNAPDFTEDPLTQVIRIVNLITYTLVTLIFLSFIRRLNLDYEEKLSASLRQKEDLINEVIGKTKALEGKSEVLEEQILARTAELEEQKQILEVKNVEKEILLKEIHHRVKNNLQIIVSLLNLQSRKFEDKSVLDAISETQNRIISMSLVHQRMYQTADSVTVELKDYTNLLVDNIRILFSEKETQISYRNEIPKDFKLDIETSIPLGLILNEMVSNSFKYAFVEERQMSEISLSIISKKEMYILRYADNGVGFPKDFNVETTKTLGVQLIIALVEQINGTLDFYNEKGAVYEIVLEK